MTSRPVLKAWIVGFALLLVANGAWLISLQMHKFSKILVLLLWISPLIAAFVSAYLSPRKKVLLGTSLAIPSAALVAALNLIYGLLGNAVDFPGIRGGAILFTVALTYSLILCALGGAAGYYLTRNRAQGTIAR